MINGDKKSADRREFQNKTAGSETEVSPGGQSKSDETASENVESRPTPEDLQKEGVFQEGGNAEACAFVVGDDASSEEQAEEGISGGEGHAEKEGNAIKTTPSSEADSIKRGLESDANHRVHDNENESNDMEIGEVIVSEGKASQNGQGGKNVGQLTQEKIEGNVTEGRNGSTEISTIEDEATSQLKQENGEVKSKDGEANSQDVQVSFHGATASMRISHSSVELGRMASSGTESNGEGSPERRRLARFLNRSTGNRTPKLNIFATAQARGRTLLPELRSKLSSFSQQVRSRSPRLNPKRPSLHNESNNQQKQLRRKCRTKIIEL